MVSHNPEAEELYFFRKDQLDRLDENTAKFGVLKRSESRWSKTALALAVGPLILGLAAVSIRHDSSLEFQAVMTATAAGWLSSGVAIMRMDRQSRQAEVVKQDSVEIADRLGNVPLAQEMR